MGSFPGSLGMRISILILLWSVGMAAGAGQTPRLVDSDDLLVVDCLLPGQVRQLGTRMTYVSARRGVKTSARDCAVRGGEYVRSDRADLRSALAVWLPGAIEGDNDARLNVGAIYERGMGAAPDYVQAAHWYRLAAEEGSVRAGLKLAELYEGGLGVPVDLTQALFWYQKATGIAGPAVTVVEQPVAAVPDLAPEVARLTEKLAGFAADNAALGAELRAAQAALEGQRSEIGSERRQLEDRVTRLSEALGDREAEVEALNTQLDLALQSLASSEGREEEVRALAEQQAQARAMEREKAQALLAAQQSQQQQTELAHQALNNQAATISRLTAELTVREESLEAQRAERDAMETRIRELQARATDITATRDLRAQAVSNASLAPPSIALIDPDLPTTRGLVKVSLPMSAPTQRIVGRVNAPAGLLSLTINGAPAETNDSGVFLTELPVTGSSLPVSIVAVDRQGQRANLEFGYEAAPLPLSSPGSDWAGFEFGRFHALVIGNNNYRNLPALDTAVGDAQTIADILGQRYGFQVTLLIDADRYQILSALNSLRENLSREDNLLIYYAGHGELDEVNMRGHWLPVDAERGSSANWISNIAVSDILNAMAAKQVLVLADSCYSGSLTRSALAELSAGKTDAEEQNWIRTMLERRSRLALTSGGLSPVLDAGGGGHSVFASAVIDVLRSNQDLLEGRDLYEQVAARVAFRASNLSFEQVPEYAPIRFAGHEAGTFFLKPSGR